MKKYLIAGANPLSGEVRVSGRKNSAPKLLTASLLTEGNLTLSNIPEVSDVHSILEILQELGVIITKKAAGEYLLNASNLKSNRVNAHLARKLASSKVLIGPLLARLGEVYYPEFSGGCKIGHKRPMNRHFEALKKLKAQVHFSDGYWHVSGKLAGGVIDFPINTVMGTENAILSAVLAEGETIILNAAEEPQIDDLITLLSKMGAKIYRDLRDNRKISIHGVTKLGGAEHQVEGDEIEAGTFAIAAAVTHGNIRLLGVRAQKMLPFLLMLSKVGVSYEVEKDGLRVWCPPECKLSGVKLETAPYPGFLTDWHPPFSVLLTQATGESYIHETIWVNRLSYTKYLNRMGASISLLTAPEAGFEVVVSDDDYKLAELGPPLTVAKILGPTPLHGESVTITDLRAGATLVLAALAAAGNSRVYGVEYVERGYERFHEKLKSLGAKIEVS